MSLDLTIEEIEGGFHFRDGFVDIQVAKKDMGYQLRFESLTVGTVNHIPLGANDPKSAYLEFRMAIDDYWSGPLNEAWRIVNKDNINKLFAPLQKYE